MRHLDFNLLERRSPKPGAREQSSPPRRDRMSGADERYAIAHDLPPSVIVSVVSSIVATTDNAARSSFCRSISA